MALFSRRVPASVAETGVRAAVHLVTATMAGSPVTQMASALLARSPEILRTVLKERANDMLMVQGPGAPR
jgi:hypothetical protein